MMIETRQKENVLENMIELLELPDSAYEKAEERYKDVGNWLSRKESPIKDNNPHIFPQGSFRLGTAIRPVNDNEEYDLDLACKLKDGITKDSNTQEGLKILIGKELESYRLYRNIKSPLEEKHRCWRLPYQDELSFHMDVVPCIPADENRRRYILESLRKSGVEEFMAGAVSSTTVSITDDRHEGYRCICDNWNISNPEGYAQWFEYRMNVNQSKILLEKAQVDKIPLFKRKTPLQRSIQLLKRHRDIMFEGKEDLKPISIIITTLAARAYNGEQDVPSAIESILSRMGNLVNQNKPQVPNPVDPEEDFADRWLMPKYEYLNLEQNFRYWLMQAKNDFDLILSTTDAEFISEQAAQKFSITFNYKDLAKKFEADPASVTIMKPKTHLISEKPAKPWSFVE